MLYYLDSTRKSILTALSVETGGIRAVILFGPPGTGKTLLAKKYAEEVAQDWINKAKIYLEKLNLRGEPKDFFEGIVNYIINRDI